MAESIFPAAFAGKIPAVHPVGLMRWYEFENAMMLTRSAIQCLFNNAHFQGQRKIAVLGLNAVQTLADG